METLADFAPSACSTTTPHTAIYKAWFGLFNLPAAAQLARSSCCSSPLPLPASGGCGRSAVPRDRAWRAPARSGWRAGAHPGRDSGGAVWQRVRPADDQLVGWVAVSAGGGLDDRYWALLGAPCCSAGVRRW